MNIINKIGVDKNDKNLYEMIEFSNQDIKSYRKDFREYHHIVSVIARHNEIEAVKTKCYKEIYHSKLGIDNYDLMIIPIVNSMDGH